MALRLRHAFQPPLRTFRTFQLNRLNQLIQHGSAVAFDLRCGCQSGNGPSGANGECVPGLPHHCPS